jgi:hypothetical protein
VDIDGDGSQEILAASSYYDIHAINATGAEPEGWPKFTGGWNAVTPAVGDFDGDGSREVVTCTREGWLRIWRTGSSLADMAEWPEFGHDPWNTGCLDTDARRPGRVVDLSAELVKDGEEATGARLTWTAPGDDGKLGQALLYDIRYLDRPIDGESWEDAIPLDEAPLPAEAGNAEELVIDGFHFDGLKEGVTYYFALQARDEGGNPSAISNIADVSCGEEEHGPVESEALSTTWYLAEGSTGRDANGHFSTWIMVQNPGTDPVQVSITYMTEDGEVDGPKLELQPEIRQTVNVAETLPDTWHVSTRVEYQPAGDRREVHVLSLL